MSRARHPIAKARQARALNRADLAKLVGASVLDVEHWEEGALFPTSIQAVRLARHLRLSLAEVLISAIEAEARAGNIQPQRTLTQIRRDRFRVVLPANGPLALEAHH